MLVIKLCFRSHVHFLYSKALGTLGLICYITYNLSAFDSLVVLCNSLIRPKLEQASVTWNNPTMTDSSKIENIKKQIHRFVIQFF